MSYPARTPRRGIGGQAIAFWRRGVNRQCHEERIEVNA